MTDVIGRVNPAYLQRVDRVNIVGYARPWREVEGIARATSSHTFCVLKGDVHGFGGLMHAGAEVPGQALEEGVRQWARKAVVAETGAGDSVLIVHEDPVFLAQAARHVMDDVYQATGQPRLRIALHYGEVQLQPSSGAEPPAVVGGSAILCASRVEPHVLPGQIWATEEFRQVLVERPSLWRTTELTTPDGSDRFNVKKEGRPEPDLGVRLYRLEF